MVGSNHEKIFQELFIFAKKIMDDYHIYPYVSCIVKDGVIVTMGRNEARETLDVTMDDQVVSIRKAQEALEIGNLSEYTLYSIFEPTILSFDVALWAGIRKFVWCIGSSSVPESYLNLGYSPKDYEGELQIEIVDGIMEEEALKLVRYAKEKDYFFCFDFN